MNCCKCSNLVLPTQDAVSCAGCSRHCHASCEFTGSNTEIRGILAILRLRESIVFLCSFCKQRIVNSNFGVLIEKINGLSATPDISKIEDDIATNRKLIESLSSKLNEMSSTTLTPVSSSRRLLRKNVSSTDFPNTESSISSMPLPVDVFGTCVDSDLVAIEVPEMKQLYVSRLDPLTTADQVVQYICKRVEDCKPDDLVCQCLVKKNRPIEQKLTFISFKISIPAKFFMKAIDPTVWPQKVLVREFILQSKNFRAPVSNFAKL